MTAVPYWEMLDAIAKSQFESDMRPMPRYKQFSNAERPPALNKHAASVTNALMEDIYAQTGLTPHIEGTFLCVCDNAHGQYVITGRDGQLPAGTSLMLVHDQTACGGETTLLMDTANLAGTLHSLAQTSAAVCWHILARQQVVAGLAPWACN